MIDAAGILAGTSVPNSGRFSIGAKNPLTNTIKAANGGGSAAQKLARLGIQAVVVEGCTKKMTSLKIDSIGVSFLPALDAPELQKHLVSCVSAIEEKPLDKIYLMQRSFLHKGGVNGIALVVTSTIRRESLLLLRLLRIKLSRKLKSYSWMPTSMTKFFPIPSCLFLTK